MKPRNWALLIFACVVAVVVQGGIGLWLISSNRPAQHREIFAAAQNDIRFDNVFNDVAVNDIDEPILPEEIAEFRQQVAAPVKDLVLTAPVTHENLSVFFIRGNETMPERKMMPLEVALANGLATVHEGISVDNHANVPLFIQGGDIIKGGSQDRTLPYDMVIPVAARRVPLPAFCVEQGRSGPRGSEISTSFQSSSEQLPTNRLHLAARKQHSQMHVWNSVRDLQTDLGRVVGDSVQSPISHTSLQLTLEHPRVRESIDETVRNLGTLPEENDVIGAVFTVNGRVMRAETYGSNAMFREMYAKLLRANAIAALAEKRAGQRAEAPNEEAVRTFLAAADQGNNVQRSRRSGTTQLRHETNGVVVFDTCEGQVETTLVHRSYLAK
ncbi:MAG: DUF6569 family protein [Gemmataceae bacterium]